MASVISETVFSRIKKRFKVFQIRQIQQKGLEAVAQKRDVFICAKTGSGKSLIYQSLPEVWPNQTVLIVCPLVNIMEEQVKYLRGVGYSALILRGNGDIPTVIEASKQQFILGSPELIVGDDVGRTLWKSMRNAVSQIVIDEAHTVLQWGGDGHKEAFREWFRHVGELRSLLPGVPLLALTATASLIRRNKIVARLGMQSPLLIVDSPDRPNVKLSVERVKSNESVEDSFDWLLQQLKQYGPSTPRTLIFCRSIADTATICAFLERCLETGFHKHFDMYHSMTLTHVKERIRAAMAIDGPLRVLVATNAAGMGVNFVNVQSVVHYGVPTDMDTYVQQLGRAGREEGSTGHSLILFSYKQMRKVDGEMFAFIKNDGCRREMLCSSYEAAKEDMVAHLCCDTCTIDCDCDSDGQAACPMNLHEAICLDDSDSDEENQNTRDVSYEEKTALFNALCKYREEMNGDSNKILNLGALHGLSDTNVTRIVEKCDKIFTPDDLLTYSDVPCGLIMEDIMRMFNDIFMDIDLEDLNEEDFETDF